MIMYSLHPCRTDRPLNLHSIVINTHQCIFNDIAVVIIKTVISIPLHYLRVLGNYDMVFNQYNDTTHLVLCSLNNYDQNKVQGLFKGSKNG